MNYPDFLSSLDLFELREELDRVNMNHFLVCMRIQDFGPSKASLRAFRKWRSRRACILSLLRGVRRSLLRDPAAQGLRPFVEELYRHASVSGVPGAVSSLGRAAPAPSRP